MKGYKVNAARALSRRTPYEKPALNIIDKLIENAGLCEVFALHCAQNKR
jgi:hypothetical protein